MDPIFIRYEEATSYRYATDDRKCKLNAGGLVTKHASSVQLTVDAAKSTASRVGSSYAISGSGVSTTDGTTAGTISAGTITSGLLSLW